MILDTLDHLTRYALPRSEAILEFIASHDCAQLPEGEIEIEGRDLFVRVMRYVLKPSFENRFETHHRYADLQYMVSGSELMQTMPLKELTPATDYDALGDYQFFNSDSTLTTDLIVHAGAYAIFYPQEPHRPSCAYLGHRGLVKKLVFKIKINHVQLSSSR